ncbi:MAG: PAS domain S-box protein [Bdellovibrionales bacterium]|nr:PAS domain S-box protein [Bdellovibrionales bacterium]
MMVAKRRGHLALVKGDETPPEPVSAPALPSAPAPAELTDLACKGQVLFEQSSDGIVTVLLNGGIVDVNPAFEEISGYLRAEIQNQQVTLLAPSAQNRVPLRARPLTLELIQTPATYEDVAIVRKDGYVRLVDLIVRQATLGHRVVSYAILRDVTEKKLLERELITKHGELITAFNQVERSNLELKSMQETLVQAGKMAALGELAAGIAHELNQPLMGIRGYAQELQELVNRELQGRPAGAEAESWFREVISNVDKMSKIIGYLRTFTRKSTEEHVMTHVHDAIEEALKMLSRQLAARGIDVKKDLGSGVPQVYANPLQLEQVLINLLANARDAIEATGRGMGVIQIRTRHEANFVEIEVRDNGVGMDDVTKGKAFNPFFTTKEVGKGMGLGLSLSYGIMNKIHGSILVESRMGQGSAFKVRVPRDFRELG